MNILAFPLFGHTLLCVICDKFSICNAGVTKLFARFYVWAWNLFLFDANFRLPFFPPHSLSITYLITLQQKDTFPSVPEGTYIYIRAFFTSVWEISALVTLGNIFMGHTVHDSCAFPGGSPCFVLRKREEIWELRFMLQWVAILVRHKTWRRVVWPVNSYRKSRNISCYVNWYLVH